MDITRCSTRDASLGPERYGWVWMAAVERVNEAAALAQTRTGDIHDHRYQYNAAVVIQT